MWSHIQFWFDFFANSGKRKEPIKNQFPFFFLYHHVFVRGAFKWKFNKIFKVWIDDSYRFLWRPNILWAIKKQFIIIWCVNRLNLLIISLDSRRKCQMIENIRIFQWIRKYEGKMHILNEVLQERFCDA